MDSASSMFQLEPVQLQFQIQTDISRLLVSNNVLWLVLKSGVVYRIDLNNPEKVFQINIFSKGSSSNVNGSGDRVVNAFVDPHGCHLVVQTASNEYHYINHKSTVSRPLAKLKGLHVTCMEFIPNLVTSSNSGPVLLGTSGGVIYECIIDSGKADRFVKQIWNNKTKTGVVSISALQKDEKRFLVLVSEKDGTILRFDVFIAVFHATSSNFAAEFKKDALVVSKKEEIRCVGADLEKFGLVYSTGQNQEFLTFGSIDSFDSKAPEFKISSAKEKFKFMTFTKYHVAIMVNDEIRFYNQLNGKLVSSLEVPRYDGEKILGLSGDHVKGTYWLYTSMNIYEIVVEDEASDIWSIMYEQKKYDEALGMLKPTDTSNRNKVLKAKGGDLFKKGSYLEAAKILAETDEPFETVTLKFLDTDMNGLRTYLIAKLSKLPRSYYMQRVMVSSWVVELFIERLNELDNDIASAKSSNLTNNILEHDVALELPHSQELEKTQKEYQSFLKKYKDFLDKETVYQIILSHNRKEELVFYSNLINDYQVVLRFYVSLKKWDDALQVLAKENNPVFVYKFATVLLINQPAKTVEVWKRLIDNLEITKLLPSILTFNSSINNRVLPEYNHALKFLQFYIDTKGCKETVVHNSLLSILITYPNLQNENLILRYLENHSPKTDSSFGRRSGKAEIHFDTDFILRLCFRYKKIQSAIYVYSMLENYEDAVKLALENDLIEVATYVADKPMDPSKSALRKRLWLKISEKLISKVAMNETFVKQRDEALKLIGVDNVEEGDNKSNKIEDVLKFLLGRCELLTIKDLLPLFPDFVVIDNFKREMVSSLETYSKELRQISQEMDESMRTSDKINKQIVEFKKTKFQILEPTESCSICHKILITRKFFIFPCNHSFHQDCLVRNILDSNDYKLKNKIYILQKKLKSHENGESKKSLQKEIDEALTTKCCLCSDIKISSIDEPFIKGSDTEAMSWNL
ncbi:unnamed protein product [Kuraishia capsulata CBS 1993]|uniref:RING-type domain-containing protein n=1 Tax=Kuraishia capsulata CBS 1993 TaxID=1382522 RepID=W6MX39_9ASCO|nr:uncharacterized protein KUCA_T00004202001 [Kuraishia capsulata CBS 1993]CDK28220.1 unnamed protein product [Kuraishia capsulata CBS 1993]